ncbi:hypothetical protein HHK36_011315 [Tetracentron sinense]|uniref:DUF7054 domain-containing protein n=1 Tax=Tetracentron sinense TaxID=13715 RepID=A0A835DH64_TETSI|nr:hypothetical protein HHK36_011315 [Tetracentron sinense]
MPTSSKSQRRVHEDMKGKKGNLMEKSSSFHGQSPMIQAAKLLRPKTHPDLLYGRKLTGNSPVMPLQLTKLLLNVTIQRSLGAVQVVMTPESTVEDLVAASVRQYEKEGRRPFLPTTDPSLFDLHYSQFSLQSLDRKEKLITLGSRNFFLCPQQPEIGGGGGGGGGGMTSGSCSNQAEKDSKITLPNWLKFMDFLL